MKGLLQVPVRAASRRPLSGWWILAVLSLVYFGVCAAASARKPLWFDELFTLDVAELPDAGSIWRALRGGMDSHLPTSYLLCHYSMALVGHTAFGLRLPSMIAFWIGLVALHRFVATRTSPEAGLCAVLLVASSVAFGYAYEARAYAATFGGTAVTLLCWQRCLERERERGRAAPLLLFLALTATLWTHYYAVLVFVPLATGEVVRAWQRRKIDGGVALALGGGVVNVALVYAFARQAAAGFALHFWAQPEGLRTIVRAYEVLFTGLWWPAGAVLVVFVSWLGWSRRGATLAPSPASAARWELAVGLSLLALPCVMWVLAKLVTHAYLFRYGLITLLGAAILFARGVALAGERAAARLAVVILVVMLPLPLLKARDEEVKGLKAQRAYAAHATRLAERTQLPVVFDEECDFLPVYQSSAAGIASRFYHLTDAEAELRIEGHDHVVREFEGMQRYRDLHAVDLRSFVAGHRRFLLMTRPPNYVPFMLQRIQEEPGVRLELVSVEDDRFAYAVTLPEGGDGPAPVPLPFELRAPASAR